MLEVNLPDFPDEAKPHEVAILLAYSLGFTKPSTIAFALHYPTKDSVYKVLRKYRNSLPSLRVSHKQHLIGKAFHSPL
jgi:hypothetical protein